MQAGDEKMKPFKLERKVTTIFRLWNKESTMIPSQFYGRSQEPQEYSQPSYSFR